jgi:hypothetical protein
VGRIHTRIPHEKRICKKDTVILLPHAPTRTRFKGTIGQKQVDFGKRCGLTTGETLPALRGIMAT